MKKLYFSLFFLAASCLVSPGLCDAETVRLRSDKVLNGDIVDVSPEGIRLELGDGGTAVIAHEDILEIKTAGPAPAAAAPAGQAGNNYLWKVEGQGTVYLYGSIHLGKPDFFPLDAEIERAFARSDSLAVEIDVVHRNPVELSQQMMNRGAYFGRDRLENHLSSDTMRVLREYLNRYGLRYEQVANLKPWMLSITLSIFEIKRLGFDENFGIDQYFLKKSPESQTILELETPEEQIDALEEVGNGDKFMAYTLASFAETESMMAQMIAAWRDGDTDTMEKITITDIIAQNPDFQIVVDRLLFDRNEKMVRKIRGFLQTPGTTFVVIGAGHFVGERGILRLLKNAGYSIEQIPKSLYNNNE